MSLFIWSILAFIAFYILFYSVLLCISSIFDFCKHSTLPSSTPEYDVITATETQNKNISNIQKIVSSKYHKNSPPFAIAHFNLKVSHYF